MAKFCPITNSRVVYLVCQECEDRVCEKPQMTILPKKEKIAHNVDGNAKLDPEPAQSSEKASDNNAKCPDCETCCHKCGEHTETMFGKTFQAVECRIFHNRIFTSDMVKANGCEYRDKDISQEKICLNCEHYLGGGDWGLACRADYYRLPDSTSEACGKFKRKAANNND